MYKVQSGFFSRKRFRQCLIDNWISYAEEKGTWSSLFVLTCSEKIWEKIVDRFNLQPPMGGQMSDLGDYKDKK